MPRIFIFLGALNGLLAVGLGAFGAHALRSRIPPDLLEVYQTSSSYHGIHALGLIAVGLLLLHIRSRWAEAAGWLLLLGILLFCGSLYSLAMTGIRPLGIVTPFGGVAFLLGWACLCTAAWQIKET